MTEEFITVGELFELIAVFVGPFLLVGGIIQYRQLRRAGMARATGYVVVTLAAALTTGLTLALVITGAAIPLSSWLPWRLAYGRPFLIPAIIAAASVTGLVWLYARGRRRAMPSADS